MSSGVGIVPLVHGKKHSASSYVCPRHVKLPGRCPVQEQADGFSLPSPRSEGVGAQSAGGQSVISKIGLPCVRLVRLEEQLQTASLVQLGQGQQCGSLECILPELGRFRLRIPSSCHSQEGHSKNQGGQTLGHSDSALLASESLAVGSFRDVSRSASGSSHQARSPSPTGPFPRQPQFLEAGGLEGLRQSYRSKGFSDQVIDTLQAARRPSTKGAYNAQWAVFKCWCSSRSVNPFHTSVALVLEFLADLFDQGKAYSTIKAYMSAFSAIRGKIDGYSFHTHPDIATFLKGVLRKRPPVKPTVSCWDLDLVLRFLSSSVFEPPDKASLANWTLKTIFPFSCHFGFSMSASQLFSYFKMFVK